MIFEVELIIYVFFSIAGSHIGLSVEVLVFKGDRVMFAGQSWCKGLEEDGEVLLLLSSCTLPPSPPLCPDHCPAHPAARGQWLTFKEEQEKRGAWCHRIACLLTVSLSAAPHKSKKSIIGIVSPRGTCPTEIPLLCFPLWQGQQAKAEVEAFY